MKKYFYFLFAISLFLCSCADVQKPELGRDSQWIQFESATYSINESSKTPVKIAVLYAAESNPNGITINFTLNSSNPSGYTVSPSNGQITIPAGQFKGFIELTPVDNQFADPDPKKRDLIVTLSFSNNSLPSGLAGEGVNLAQSVVTIVENDCPFELKDFVGTYSALEDGYVDSAGKQILYDIKATLGTEANTLMLENVWDVKGVTTAIFDYSDPANPRINFKTGELLFVHPTLGATNIYDLKDLTPPDLTTPSIFKVCTKEIDLYFSAKDANGYYPKTHIKLTKK